MRRFLEERVAPGLADDLYLTRPPILVANAGEIVFSCAIGSFAVLVV